MAVLLLVLIASLSVSSIFSAQLSKVIVTGAAGRTGSLVFKKLLDSDKFYPVAVVRSEKSAKKLRKTNGLQKDQVFVSDVTQGVEEFSKTIETIGGEDLSIIMCTSAVPKIKVKRRVH